MYQSDVDLHPLRGCYKENERHTVKFNVENSGGIIECFRAAQKVVGNETSFVDLAAALDSKAEEEGWILKSKQSTFSFRISR